MGQKISKINFEFPQINGSKNFGNTVSKIDLTVFLKLEKVDVLKRGSGSPGFEYGG